jgi:hypothetical protein
MLTLSCSASTTKSKNRKAWFSYLDQLDDASVRDFVGLVAATGPEGTVVLLFVKRQLEKFLLVSYSRTPQCRARERVQSCAAKAGRQIEQEFIGAPNSFKFAAALDQGTEVDGRKMSRRWSHLHFCSEAARSNGNPMTRRRRTDHSHPLDLRHLKNHKICKRRKKTRR